MSGSKRRLLELEGRFKEEAEAASECCVNVAEGFGGYELKLAKKAGNNKSLTEFAFNVLKLPVLARSDKTGAPSLDKHVVAHWLLTLDDPVQKRFVEKLADARKRGTALGFLAAYQRFWKTLDRDGVGKMIDPDWFVLHPSLNQTGTDTLRFSCNNPNAQQIGKPEDENAPEISVRYPFGPGPGREWWSLDYENIELRIPAFEVIAGVSRGEKVMMDLFEKPNDAPFFGSWHLLNASIVYPDEFWPLADQKGAFKKRYSNSLYQWIKNFNFAIQYGCQRAKADQTARKQGAYDAVKKGLPEVTKLTQYWIDHANRFGYVSTIPDKTVDPDKGYPLICGRRGSISPTIPFSYHVQSTAMWCTRKAMVRCHEQLKAWTLETGEPHKMAMQVHDEIVFDLPKRGKANLPKVLRLKELMEMSGADIDIPLKVAHTYNPVAWSLAGEIN